MLLYNVVGSISSLLFVGCLWGLLAQIRKVHARRKVQPGGGASGYATQSLSVNGFFSSFFGFYAFLLYSIMLPGIDWYIFGTRLFAALATWLVLLEIFRDRMALSQRMPFVVASLALVSAFVAMGFRDEVSAVGRLTSEVLAVVASLVMLQGGVQQIRKIVAARCTGAMSLPMVLIFFAKDMSNVAFGLVLGWQAGWPLILLGVVNGGCKAGVGILYLIYPEEAEQPGQPVG